MTNSTDTRRRAFDDQPINPDMGEGRFQDTLRRFRAAIAGGLSPETFDSTFPGSKYTSAAWGLCSCEDLSAYPDVNDHTFPTRVIAEQRDENSVLVLSPRSPPHGATCPMDRGWQTPDPLNPGHWGCFYRCRLFSPEQQKSKAQKRTRRAPPPTQAEALALYDKMIAEREAKFGKKTAADDGEDHWRPNAWERPTKRG